MKVSSASSARVMSTRVPKTVVVLMKDITRSAALRAADRAGSDSDRSPPSCRS
jgi:hypothetical protein